MEPLETIGGPIQITSCDTSTSHFQAYEFTPTSRKADWLMLEDRLMEIIGVMASHSRDIDQKKHITLPLRPSAELFADIDRNKREMHAKVNKARRRFTHLLACVTYLLQSEILTSDAANSSSGPQTLRPYDRWLPALQRLPIPDTWLARLLTSQGTRTDGFVRRVGVFLDLNTTKQYGANIGFYVKCQIPVWYFWDSVAVDAVRKNSAMLQYAPSPEEIYAVLEEPRRFSEPVQQVRAYVEQLRARIDGNNQLDEPVYTLVIQDNTIRNLWQPTMDHHTSKSPYHRDIRNLGWLIRLAFPTWTFYDISDVTRILPYSQSELPPIAHMEPGITTNVLNSPLRDALIQTLRLRYGFNPRTERPSTSPSEDEWTKCLGNLGFQVYASLDLDIKQDLVEFVTALKNNTMPPTTLSDIYSDSTTLDLRANVESMLTPIDGGSYKLSPEAQHPLFIVLHTAAHAMYACRLQLSSTFDVALALLDVGIPFSTSLTCGTAVESPDFSLVHNNDTSVRRGYTFSLEDYETYVSRRANVFKQTQAQSVLSRGGIAWRLAIEVVRDIGVVAQTLTDDNVAQRRDEGTNPTISEWSDIYGLIPIRDGDGNAAHKATFVSWWPTDSQWRKGRMAIGWWTADNEEWFQDRLWQITHKNAQPLSSSSWASELKHGPKIIGKIRDYNETLQRQFLSDVFSQNT